MEIFNNGDYKFISNIIEEKIFILKENRDFYEKYMKLSEIMDELESTLSEKQKNQFREMIQLFYETEAYYFAFSFSLGVRYGEDLKKM